MFKLVSMGRARANRLNHIRVEDAAVLCVCERERYSVFNPECVGHVTHLSFESGITLAAKLVPEPCGHMALGLKILP